MFSTFLNQIKVVNTYSKVRIECDKLATLSTIGTGVTATLVGSGVGNINGLCMYISYISKIVRIDEFEQLQIQSLQNARILLKERFSVNFNFVVGLQILRQLSSMASKILEKDGTIFGLPTWKCTRSQSSGNL